MPTINEPAIRLFGGFTQDQLIDVLTSAAPSLWRGTDVVFQIGLGQGGIQSVANLQSLTLEIKDLTNKIGAALVSKTVTAFDDATTQDTWDAGTAQHALIPLTNEDTAIPAGTYWLVLSVVTTDNPARIYTAGGTILGVTEDGAQGGGDAPYFTQSQSDARYALKGWVTKSAAYTLAAGDQILADTSAAALTLTLPATPSAGDAVAIQDASESFGTNNLTVSCNGQLIESNGADGVYSTEGVRLYFVFFGGGIGWRVVTIAGASGGGSSAALLVSATVGSAGSVNLAHTAGTLIPYDTFALNTGGQYDAGTGMWTCPKTGVYLFGMRTSIPTYTYGSNSGFWQAVINETAFVGTFGFPDASPSGHSTDPSDSMPMMVNAGDQVGFYVENYTDTNQTANSFNLDIYSL